MFCVTVRSQHFECVQRCRDRSGFQWRVPACERRITAPRQASMQHSFDRIIAVVTDQQIMENRGPATNVVDLGGRLLLPGFNDTHVHFGSAAKFLEFNIMAARKQSTFVQRVKRLTESLPDGEWITGGVWGAYDQWALGSAGDDQIKPFVPDMKLVEGISKNHPIFIGKFDNSEFAAFSHS